MTTQQQENNESIEFVEQPVPEPETESAPPPEETSTTEETAVGDTAVPEGDAAPPPAEAPSQAAPSPQPTPQAAPAISQKEVDELYERRTAEQQRDWREKVGRQARAYQQQLQEQGYMEDQARDQARRYIQQEQRYRKLEQESSDSVSFVQGKQAAAMYYMKQHGLANKQMLDDFVALQTSNTPEEMEREVKRMKRERDLIAENTRLKQGRVSPQTFDNSQGAAEATSNQDRLLDAYINGDRSEAAIRAAKRISMGN